jgi:hypothetical protein
MGESLKLGTISPQENGVGGLQGGVSLFLFLACLEHIGFAIFAFNHPLKETDLRNGFRPNAGLFKEGLLNLVSDAFHNDSPFVFWA